MLHVRPADGLLHRPGRGLRHRGIDRQVAVEVVNLLFAVVAGAAVLGIGRALYGWRVGAAALVAYAVWPAGALMVDVRLPHVAYDALVAGAVWVAVALPAGWRGSALVGMLLGFAQYMRPSTIALLPAFVLARVWSGGPLRRLIAGAIVPLGVAFLIVLIPAIWHNWTTYGEASVSTSTFGGHSLYIGTDQRTGGRFSGRPTTSSSRSLVRSRTRAARSARVSRWSGRP